MTSDPFIDTIIMQLVIKFCIQLSPLKVIFSNFLFILVYQIINITFKEGKLDFVGC